VQLCEFANLRIRKFVNLYSHLERLPFPPSQVATTSIRRRHCFALRSCYMYYQRYSSRFFVALRSHEENIEMRDEGLAKAGARIVSNKYRDPYRTQPYTSLVHV
jgi:hypothetical protein